MPLMARLKRRSGSASMTVVCTLVETAVDNTLEARDHGHSMTFPGQSNICQVLNNPSVNETGNISATPA
jgi:hypothetical protein